MTPVASRIVESTHKIPQALTRGSSEDAAQVQ
jgi:hypothetical protein